MNDNIQVIVATLQRIQEEGKRNNFAVFEGDVKRNYYIQFSVEPGTPTLHAEAVSNRFLKPEHLLTSSQQARLRELGWTPPQTGRNHNPNFYHRWEVKTEDERLEVARFVARTFVEAYGLPADKPLIVTLALE